MATKVGPQNQHDVLHGHYGQHYCCLCRVEHERDELRARVAELDEKNEELNTACENYAHVLATEPFKIRADALAAQLGRVRKVAYQAIDSLGNGPTRRQLLVDMEAIESEAGDGD